MVAEKSIFCWSRKEKDIENICISCKDFMSSGEKLKNQ